MSERTLQQFSDELASSAATPGGGGACALAGSLAASLGSMVGSLTLGKKKYADVQEEIGELIQQSESLRLTLLQDIQEDAAAFEPLSKAYGLPKDTLNRDEILEDCLKQAAEAPYQLMIHISQAITLLERYGQIGSKLVISDAATGAALAYGALLGASINVRVNTRLMKDRDYAVRLNQKVDELIDCYGPKALAVFETINERMK